VEIRINDELLDYTLEHEKALGEVIDGIQEWLASNGFTMTAIRKDAADLKLHSRLEWQDDPVDEINSLEITALHPTDLVIEKLTAAIQYLDLIKQDANADSPVIADLLTGIDDVSQMIDDVLIPGSGDSVTFGNRLAQLALETGIPEGVVSDGRFNEFLGYISNLIVVLYARLRELTDPERELRASAPALGEVLENIGEISVLLQTGKDAEAIRRLVAFLEIAQKVLRLAGDLENRGLLDLSSLEISETPTTGFAGELNGYLLELERAIEVGDTVMVGDLLEYEIAPRLGALLEALGNGGER